MRGWDHAAGIAPRVKAHAAADGDAHLTQHERSAGAASFGAGVADVDRAQQPAVDDGAGPRDPLMSRVIPSRRKRGMREVAF